jgi:hypothetical protein
MADTFNVPLLGPTNKYTVLAVVGGGIGVSAYMIHREAKAKAAAAAAAAAKTTKGATGYGYGYGYGASPNYGMSGYGYGAYGEFNPYPQEEVYGYGAEGYGLYNPATGQYYGTGSTGPTGTTVGTTPATNGQWEQDAISILGTEGYSATAVQQALGNYLLGDYTGWNAQDQAILAAAVGAVGEPPDPPSAEPPGVGTGTGTGTGVTSGQVTVPNVVGMSIDDAGVALSHVGDLKIKVTSPATRKKGTTYQILTESPAAGTSVAPGSTVSVTAKVA